MRDYGRNEGLWHAADERAGSTSAGIARGDIARELTGGDVTGDKTPGGGTGEADQPAAGPLGDPDAGASNAGGTGEIPGGGVVDGDVTDLMGNTDTSTGTGAGRTMEQ